jgi:rhamnose transport system substrate-binding protein
MFGGRALLALIAYGDHLRGESASEAEGLLRAYPQLNCIIAPTTVGLAAAGMVLTDRGLAGKVGDRFEAGRLGEYTAVKAADGTEIRLGAPFQFDKSNIEEWKRVY